VLRNVQSEKMCIMAGAKLLYSIRFNRSSFYCILIFGKLIKREAEINRSRTGCVTAEKAPPLKPSPPR